MAKAIPTKRQLEFLDWEFGAFFHFGLRSYYPGYRDWDKRDMDEKVFNPTELDCESWLRAFKAAGAQYAIFVAKHHDGFANWPSKYSDYSVANTPWRDGKGDVVREFTDACRKVGLKVGIYYSPAQRDWSKFQNEKEYDDYFIGQISELLSDYGQIDYLWFDGCGSENHEYGKSRIIHAIRSLQPEILIFNMWDPDTKWIGNESGWAPVPNFNTVKAVNFSVMTDELDELEDVKFLPGECDTKMRSTWFDCEDNEDTIFSLEELVGLYYMSVGRGANLLLNIGPNARGLLPEADAERLREFGEEIKRRFETPLAAFSDPKRIDGGYVIHAETPELVDHLIIQENLTEGESVTGFRIYAGSNLLYMGQTIGHKAICRFPTVKATELRVEVTESDGDFRLDSVRAYYVG